MLLVGYPCSELKPIVFLKTSIIQCSQMHGAASRRNEVYIEERDVIVSELSTVRLRWINKSDEKQNRAEQARD